MGRRQQVLPDRCRDRRLAGADAQFVAGIGDVKIDGAFADVQDAADFPTGLALCRPIQAVLFTDAQQLHVTCLPPGFDPLMKVFVSKCITAFFVSREGMRKR
jgi:hypothetical protein